MTPTGTTRRLDATYGAVRVEDIYDTAIEDLWAACTEPDRLRRWVAEVSGDLRVGGLLHAVFTSTWAGDLRVDVCDAPRHLLLTSEPGTDEETRIEAWLTPEGVQTRLVVEERGVPLAQLHFYGAGWQAHLEDLSPSLIDDHVTEPTVTWSEHTPAPKWLARWNELTAAYHDA